MNCHQPQPVALKGKNDKRQSRWLSKARLRLLGIATSFSIVYCQKMISKEIPHPSIRTRMSKRRASKSTSFDVVYDATAHIIEMPQPSPPPKKVNKPNKRNKALVIILEKWYTRNTSRNCHGDLLNTALSYHGKNRGRHTMLAASFKLGA